MLCGASNPSRGPQKETGEIDKDHEENKVWKNHMERPGGFSMRLGWESSQEDTHRVRARSDAGKRPHHEYYQPSRVRITRNLYSLGFHIVKKIFQVSVPLIWELGWAREEHTSALQLFGSKRGRESPKYFYRGQHNCHLRSFTQQLMETDGGSHCQILGRKMKAPILWMMGRKECRS